MSRSFNPAMKPFENPQTWDTFTGVADRPKVMTIGGTAQAVGIQLGCAFAGAMIAWMLFAKGVIAGGLSTPLVLGVWGVLFIGGLFMARKPQLAIVLGPIFSAAYGALAGLFSYMIAFFLGSVILKNPELIGASGVLTKEAAVAAGSGVIFQAIVGTLGVAGIMLVLNATNVLRISGRAAKIVFALAGAVAMLYVVGMVLRLFGTSIPLIHEAGPVGIGFSLLVVGIAAFSLSAQFELVREGVNQGAPKYMEWYVGYALVSTIIWLYIEILHLLFKLYLMFNRE